MQMYPGWSARDNYAVHKKRRKRKVKAVEKSEDEEGACGEGLCVCTRGWAGSCGVCIGYSGDLRFTMFCCNSRCLICSSINLYHFKLKTPASYTTVAVMT